MKKFIYLLVLVFTLSSTSFAADKSGKEVQSEATQNAKVNFLRKFHNISDVSWTVSADFQKATFVKDGIKLAAFFDGEGNYIATTQYVDYKNLPAISKSRLNKIYAEYTVADVVKYNIDSPQSAGSVMLGARNCDTIYFASLKRGNDQLVLKITPDGDISNLKSL